MKKHRGVKWLLGAAAFLVVAVLVIKKIWMK